MTVISDSDLTILRILQIDARARLESIAEDTRLSVATVQRRIKALRAGGYISGDMTVLDPALLGFAMVLLTWLGGRATRRYMNQGSSRRRATTDPDDWTKKPIVPNDEE